MPRGSEPCPVGCSAFRHALVHILPTLLLFAEVPENLRVSSETEADGPSPATAHWLQTPHRAIKSRKEPLYRKEKSMRNASCTEGNTRRAPGLAQLIKSHEVTAASSMSILLQGRRGFPTAAFPFALGGTAMLLQQGFYHYCKPRPVSGGLG